MDKPRKKGKERISYKGRIIEVVEQDMEIGDKVITFERARRAPGTRLIVITPEGKMKVSREYRSELGTHDYRLPGGKVFDSLGELNKALDNNLDIAKEAEAGARREAKEEIGIDPLNIDLLSVSKAGATIEWDLFYFIIDDYRDLGSQQLEDGEVIEIIDMSFEDVWNLCMRGEFKEDRSAAKLLQFLNGKI